MRLKFHSSRRNTYSSHFTDKFLKFEEKFEIWPALCKFTILFLKVKLKLGHSFFQFIHRLKIGTFECWSSAVLSILLPIHKEIENLDF